MDSEVTRLGAAGFGTEAVLGPFQRGGLRGASVVTMWCPLSTDIYGAEVGTEIHGVEHGTKFGAMCFGALGLGAECLCPLFEAVDLGCGPKIKFIPAHQRNETHPHAMVSLNTRPKLTIS
jgi:hypothetical protein